MLFTVLLGAVVLYLLYKWTTLRPKNFPPGLPVLPFVGCVPFIKGKLIHFTMESWRKTYGPVVGLMIGQYPNIAVVEPEAVIEVLKRDEFQGRPDGEELRQRSFGKRLGIMFSDGPFWVEQRRFTLRHLRDFGFGKKSMEKLIFEEVEEVMEEIKGKTVQMSGFFNVSMINVLWAMVAGTRLSRKDEQFNKIFDSLTLAFRSGSPTNSNLIRFFPILKKIAPEWSGHASSQRLHNQLITFFRDEVHRHEKTLDENHPRDFMDVYLIEMRKQSDKPESTFTEEGLIVASMDMFNAGTESVSNTLGFALLYMVLYPEVQRKVQAELDTEIGRARRPELHDRLRLPYVEAVLAEVTRINSIAPLTPPHRVTQDTKLHGYSIPKDTTVLINLWCLLHDEKHWGDPSVFRPERFIDKDGKFVKDDWLLIFGTGKRFCLGEPLARNNLFLFFTSLLQEFSMNSPEGDPIPSTIALPGFTTAPQPFRVHFTPR